MIELELPDTVLFDGLVLVNGCAHRSARPERELLHHAGANLRSPTIGRDVDHGLPLNVVAQPVLGGTLFAERVEEKSAHAFAPDVHAALCELHGTVGGEEIGQIVPEILVQVVAVGAL